MARQIESNKLNI